MGIEGIKFRFVQIGDLTLVPACMVWFVNVKYGLMVRYSTDIVRQVSAVLI